MQYETDCMVTENSEEQATEPPSKTESDEPEPGGRTLRVSLSRSRANWNDWRWQVRNRIRSLEQLAEFLPSVGGRCDLQKVIDKYPMAITPYYASLIRKPDISDPVFRLCVPNIQELYDISGLQDDPLEEHCDMPVPGLVHRYRDRVLLIATTMCSMYCRHCTRKRIAGTRESSISAARLRQVVEYLNHHPEVSDVIISGGDPFTMSDNAIEAVLSAIRSVPTVSVIRIGTRVPVVMPMRITDELVAMLKKYHPLWINTHFNHPNEITAESKAACTRLADAGIPMGNQTVLLKGINDDPKVIESLCRELVAIRTRPYYLYQCDLVRGVEHLRTSIRKGIEIMEYLRGRLSGIAIPMFVVDAPGGGGKIPVLPNYVVSMSTTHTVLRNFEGMLISYPEPGCEETGEKSSDGGAGVWELASGRGSVIVPQRSSRMKRRADSVLQGACGHESYMFEN